MSKDAIKAIILGIAIAGFSYGGLNVVEKLQKNAAPDLTTKFFESANIDVDHFYDDIKEQHPEMSDEAIKNEFMRSIYVLIREFNIGKKVNKFDSAFKNYNKT